MKDIDKEFDEAQEKIITLYGKFMAQHNLTTWLRTDSMISFAISLVSLLLIFRGHQSAGMTLLLFYPFVKLAISLKIMLTSHATHEEMMDIDEYMRSLVEAKKNSNRR